MLKALASTDMALGKDFSPVHLSPLSVWHSQMLMLQLHAGFCKLQELGLGASWSQAAVHNCIPPTDRPTQASPHGGSACTGLFLAVFSTPNIKLTDVF